MERKVYLAVDSDGTETMFYGEKPVRLKSLFEGEEPGWGAKRGTTHAELEEGSIADLIGRTIAWKNEPVEL